VLPFRDTDQTVLDRAAEAPALSRPSKTLFGHPPGLTVLFMIQMWAEFSYFGLQALLVYYMTQHLGFTQAKSSLVYGAYGAAAFFSPFFGGIIADRWLGRTRSVVIGGLLMMFGHFAMAFESLLFPALALVAIGNGLFMPPLAVQVGGLYADDDPRQAQAFSAYYMGINLGGLLAPLVCGTLGEIYGWHWGFAAAGFGMLAGLVIYLRFRHLLPNDPPSRSQIAPAARVGLSALDWGNVRLLIGIIAVVVMFRVGYEQSGNVIALWVEHQTDRGIDILGWHYQIPATWFQSINPLLIIALTPLLIRYWAKHAERHGPANLLARMSLGCLIASLSMVVMVVAAALNAQTGRPVGAGWVTGYFVLLTIGELLVIPVGLTLIGALSPVQIAAMTMGAWYIAKFLGSLLAGVMGAYWGVVPATLFFGAGALSVLVAAVLLYAMGRMRPIRLG
jgi:POT family proton-dependent oligopeptide transporter